MRKFLQSSVVYEFLQNSYSLLGVYFLMGCVLHWLTFLFFSQIDEGRLYFLVRHLETLMLGGALIFFILLHFKISIHFHLKYNHVEFIFLKALFFLIFNALCLYMSLLVFYLLRQNNQMAMIVSCIYAHFTTWGCLVFNYFFNKRAQIYCAQNH